MNALRRILAVLFLLLGGAGLLLCLAALIGVWPVRSALQDRLGSLYGRVDGVIDTAGQDLRVVREALGKSRETLTAYKNAPAPTSQNAPKRRLLLKTLSASLGKELAPDATRLRATMTRLAEASVVLEAFLRDLRPFLPAGQGAGDDELSQLLSEVTRASQELSVLFPESAGDRSPQSEPARDVRIPDAEQALDRIEQLVGVCEAHLGAFADRLARVKEQTRLWMHWGPIVVTVALIWTALGQISLFLLGRRMLNSRRSEAEH